MQKLSNLLKAKTNEGQPLPAVMQGLHRIGAKFRRSQVSLIAGAPGGGKSALAVWLVTRMKVPTIYFSADADRMTIAKSIGAGLMDKLATQDQVELLLAKPDSDVSLALGSQTQHIWWNFEPTPTIRDVEEELEAYGYVYGQYPQVIVIDNLMDMAEEDTRAMSDVQVELKRIAREYGCHVMILAHVTGEYTNGDKPIPRSGMMFKPDKKAELILTIYQVQPGVMGVRVVKNRTGPANTAGTYGVDVPWLAEFGYFGG